MKRILIAMVGGLAMAGAAFAQGVVSWSTITPTFMTAQTNSVVLSAFAPAGSMLPLTVSASQGGTSTTANAFYYELLYNTAGTQQAAPSDLAGLSAWTDAGLEAVNNTGTAGRLQTLNASVTATVPWAPGSYDSIILVGWSANLGSTWAIASSNLVNYSANEVGLGLAYFGVTPSGYITPNAPTPSAPGATLWGTAANAAGTPIFSPNTQLDSLGVIVVPEAVTFVPEPGTLALAALGGASLLMFRRKK
jgi:hypothetical protein